MITSTVPLGAFDFTGLVSSVLTPVNAVRQEFGYSAYDPAKLVQSGVKRLGQSYAARKAPPPTVMTPPATVQHGPVMTGAPGVEAPDHIPFGPMPTATSHIGAPEKMVPTGPDEAGGMFGLSNTVLIGGALLAALAVYAATRD